MLLYLVNFAEQAAVMPAGAAHQRGWAKGFVPGFGRPAAHINNLCGTRFRCHSPYALKLVLGLGAGCRTRVRAAAGGRSMFSIVMR
jgi:hypothetical protein